MKRSLGKNFALLNTPAVLYFVLILAFANLFVFLYNGDMRHTMIFVLVGVVTSFFSKNMIVILTMAIAFTGIAKLVYTNGRFEGMTDGEDDTENTDAVSSTEPDANSATDKKKKEEATENMEGNEDEKEEEDTDKESFDMLQKNGQELIKVQSKIEAGFKELEPYMDKADRLLTRIEESMSTIEEKYPNGRPPYGPNGPYGPDRHDRPYGPDRYDRPYGPDRPRAPVSAPSAPSAPVSAPSAPVRTSAPSAPSAPVRPPYGPDRPDAPGRPPYDRRNDRRY